MTRRTATLLLAGLLLVVLASVSLLRPMPFVTTRPGPTIDTLGTVDGRPVVDIDGQRTYPTRGRLDLTTVRVTSPDAEIMLPEAVQAWFDPHREVLPKDVVYPPDQTVAEVERENAEEMQTSQQDAVVAALRELGYDVPRAVVVVSILEGAPALGHLRAGDAIRSVNGVSVRKPEQVGEALQSTDPGEPARFVVERDDQQVALSVPTRADAAEPGRTVVGISVGNGYDLPVDVRIRLGEEIGGPSAGTMFAQAIVDKMTPGALTGGAAVAGTGAITSGGQVGQIGGIQQKIAGAAEEGATIFLVPADNCSEVVDSDAAGDALRLVKVNTLHEAVTALQRLARDQDAEVPSCGG
jgi:PDZ domain-containing protein